MGGCVLLIVFFGLLHCVFYNRVYANENMDTNNMSIEIKTFKKSLTKVKYDTVCSKDCPYYVEEGDIIELTCVRREVQPTAWTDKYGFGPGESWQKKLTIRLTVDTADHDSKFKCKDNQTNSIVVTLKINNFNKFSITKQGEVVELRNGEKWGCEKCFGVFRYPSSDGSGWLAKKFTISDNHTVIDGFNTNLNGSTFTSIQYKHIPSNTSKEYIYERIDNYYMFCSYVDTDLVIQILGAILGIIAILLIYILIKFWYRSFRKVPQTHEVVYAEIDEIPQLKPTPQINQNPYSEIMGVIMPKPTPKENPYSEPMLQKEKPSNVMCQNESPYSEPVSPKEKPSNDMYQNENPYSEPLR